MQSLTLGRCVYVCFACGITSQAIGQSLALPAAPQGVQTFEAQGFKFVRVQASDVGAFSPNDGSFPLGRPFGGGSWNFGIARTEITLAQAVELPNAFYDVPVPNDQPWSFSMNSVLMGRSLPRAWASVPGPQGRGLWSIPLVGENLPLRDTTGFFHAAVYCNWLHNNKQATVDALLTGAYDLRGWDDQQASTWMAVTRSPTARFFLPTYDEWAVATFYDPNRNGTGGWWQSMYGRDRLPIGGAPGVGETSVGWEVASGPFAPTLPVAAYGNQQSPWGLFDTSGTFEEYLETHDPFAAGSYISAGSPGGRLFQGAEIADLAGQYISGTSFGTFRLATSIPSPAGTFVLVLALGTMIKREQRE
jgi:hypothetical protein